MTNPVWSFGASLAQPMFNGGLTGAQVEAARETYQASVASYRQTVLTAIQQVDDNRLAGSQVFEVLLEIRREAGSYFEISSLGKYCPLPLAWPARRVRRRRGTILVVDRRPGDHPDRLQLIPYSEGCRRDHCLEGQIGCPKGQLYRDSFPALDS